MAVYQKISRVTDLQELSNQLSESQILLAANKKNWRISADLLNQKRMQGELLKASSNLEEYYTDKDVRQGIKKLINNSGTLSKEYAENVYALSRGKLANKFNSPFLSYI